MYLFAGTITVFINGIASEVPRVPLDLRAVFGPNVMLVHSSGQLLPVNEYGILQHSLQNGESYFLVSISDLGIYIYIKKLLHLLIFLIN